MLQEPYTTYFPTARDKVPLPRAPKHSISSQWKFGVSSECLKSRMRGSQRQKMVLRPIVHGRFLSSANLAPWTSMPSCLLFSDCRIQTRIRSTDLFSGVSYGPPIRSAACHDRARNCTTPSRARSSYTTTDGNSLTSLGRFSAIWYGQLRRPNST